MTKLTLISAILLVGVLQSRAQTDEQLRDPEYLVDQYNQLVAKHNALIEKTRDLIQNQSKKIEPSGLIDAAVKEKLNEATARAAALQSQLNKIEQEQMRFG